MTVSEIHAAAVAAYKEALADTEFKDVEITPADRETQDIHRGQCETQYDASYSREIGLKVTTVSEELFYYANSPKKWKVELNNFQEYIEARLLKGVSGLEVTDITCDTGRYGDSGGALTATFNLVDYEEVDFDGRETDAEVMEEVDTELSIHTA